MRYLLALEIMVLLALGAYLTWPDSQAAMASTSVGTTPGLDDYAWQLSVLTIKSIPFLIVLCAVYLALRVLPRHLERRYEVEKIRAERQAPEGVTSYSPRLSLNYGSRGLAPALPPPAIEIAPAVESAPSFAQLLASGQISKDMPLILGYTNGTPLQGSWKDLYSSAVAGISGSGKTTTIRFLAAQAALHGAKFAILDPHADTGDESLAATLQPLQPAMLCEPATVERDMLAVIKLMQSQLDARLHGSTDRTPLLLCVDEFTRLMRSQPIAAPLAGLLESIADEGRKVGIFCTLSGQSWTADRAGGTPLRDSLASCYVHRLRRNQARLLLSTDEARLAEGLEPGRALLLRTNGDCAPVAIPLATPADVERVGALLATPAQPPRNAPAISAKEAQVLAMLQGGATVPEVVKALYGSTGAAYTAGVKEVSSIIGQALRQR